MVEKKPPVVYKMRENALAAGALPRTPLGELIALLQNPQLVGRGLAGPSPRTPPSLSAVQVTFK